MAENQLTIRIFYVDMHHYHHVDFFNMMPEFYAEYADRLKNISPLEVTSTLDLLNKNARRVNGPNGEPGSAIVKWQHPAHEAYYLDDPQSHPDKEPISMMGIYYTEDGKVDKTSTIMNGDVFEETRNGITMADGTQIEEHILNMHRQVLNEKRGVSVPKPQNILSL